jgi:hypothetical protein
MWLYCASSFPCKIGAAFALTSTWSDAATTRKIPAGTWTKVTVTFTVPSVWCPEACLYIMQTDTTARTFYVDGVRLIPGTSSDDYALAHWDLASEPDPLVMNGTLPANSVADGLATLNALSLSRHWVAPSLSTPYWRYVTQSRDEQAALASVETFTDSDFADFRSVERDRDGIVNVLDVPYTKTVPTNPPGTTESGTAYYSDEASALLYGPRPATLSAGASLYYLATVPDVVGPAYLTRRSGPLTRPQLVVQNRFPSQLQREVGDLVTVTCSRLGITAVEFSIQALTTVFLEQANLWETTYQLEESPF